VNITKGLSILGYVLAIVFFIGGVIQFFSDIAMGLTLMIEGIVLFFIFKWLEEMLENSRKIIKLLSENKKIDK